ncbi:short-chain dehydrogenase/reductase SDR [Fibrella aestuarina BUZ 2]|uniref:Short-chain dehydrogenase/reductase SDR n=1 Tax=Fibrella aestuarina BUZ 2 TaxID=1166018 RepID=I0K1Z8_9BACT|nr:SDR family oxidoreductase [Fibrella aestuarina]CCG98151.1 short-chain dehydrogenase/reductase SDR [Fibrella aestuarina BUZ 2]
MDAKKKIALITGGSRGLGKNMALAIAKKGFDVVLTYHSQQGEAEAVVAQIEQLGQKAAALQLDTGAVSSFEPFSQQLTAVLGNTFAADRFDFLVNNAGIGGNSPIGQTNEAEFDQLVNIHFKGVLFLTEQLLPLLNDGGRIINISSGLARFTSPGRAVYGSLKGAVETLTLYMAKELGPRGITVNVVAPGAIETDFSGGVVRDNPDVNRHIASITALGRVGLPDDIGGVVAFLCTDDARWINAQRIEVSGGMNL